jgi:hypothetical protein
MTWSPLPTVSVDGVSYTGDALGDLTITRGRDTVYADAPAGYARVQLVDIAGTGLAINVAQTLTITVEDSASADVTVFVGYITDVSADLYDAGIGPQNAGSIYSILAVGPLARLSRRIVLDGGRPAETDGDRILAAIEAGLGTTWEEVGGSWGEVDPTLTWDTFDPGFDPNLIDVGVFDLVALDAFDGGYTALEVAQQASDSGEGLLYETLDGFIGWDNADARGTATTSIVLNETHLLASGLRTSSSAADLANRVTVQFPTGAETAQDDASIGQFTLYSRIVFTQLVNATNAADRAESYVQRHAYPVINLDTITVRLDTITDDTLRDELLEVRSGTPISLTGLPPTIGLTFLDAFVEGTTLTLDRFRAELRLNVSDASLSYFTVRWSGVDPTLAWEDVSATLEWQDATTVTA